MKLILNTIHPAPYFDRLIEYLKNNNVDTECWYITDKSSEKKWKQYKAKDVHLYRELSTFSKLKHFAKADLVILAWGNKENIIIGLFLFILRVPYGYYLDFPNPLSTRTKSYSSVLKKLIMCMATYMFPASYSCGQYLEYKYKVNKNKIRIFPYSHSEAPPYINKINSEREIALKSGEKPRLLIASRFVLRKGYTVVLKAFNILFTTNVLDNIDITIVGDGELYKEFHKKFLDLSSDIKFLGWVENTEYENILNNSDIYLHPSLFEPFGIPPLDAMIRKKYVIVTDQVKSTDIFDNKQGIKLYKPNDSIELAKIISEVVANKNSIYEITKGNSSLCQEYYSLNINLSAIKQIGK